MSLHDIWLGDVMPLSGIAVSIGRNTNDPPAPPVPVFDVHDRTTILYDNKYFLDTTQDPPALVFLGAYSGILSFSAEKQHAELIPSHSGVQAVCPGVYIDVYNNANATTFPMALYLTTERVNSHSSVFSFDSSNDAIYIWASGTYEITMRAGITQTSVDGRRTMLGRLQAKEMGGNWAVIGGSNCYLYSRDSTNGEDTSMVTVILEPVRPGTAIRGYVESVVSEIVTDGLELIADGCSLTIVKLE